MYEPRTKKELKLEAIGWENAYKWEKKEHLQTKIAMVVFFIVGLVLSFMSHWGGC
jgi:hypothetical protein